MKKLKKEILDNLDKLIDKNDLKKRKCFVTFNGLIETSNYIIDCLQKEWKKLPWYKRIIITIRRWFRK